VTGGLQPVVHDRRPATQFRCAGVPGSKADWAHTTPMGRADPTGTVRACVETSRIAGLSRMGDTARHANRVLIAAAALDLA
jgi:hypothetical protein